MITAFIIMSVFHTVIFNPDSKTRLKSTSHSNKNTILTNNCTSQKWTIPISRNIWELRRPTAGLLLFHIFNQLVYEMFELVWSAGFSAVIDAVEQCLLEISLNKMPSSVERMLLSKPS